MSSKFADGTEHFWSNLLLTDAGSYEMYSLVHCTIPERNVL